MTTLVVHANDTLAFEKGAVYIGRRNTRARNPIAHAMSPYANPFVIGKPSPFEDHPFHLMTAMVAVENFRWVIEAANETVIAERFGLNQFSDPTTLRRCATVRAHVIAHVHELQGSTLVCWCAKPDRDRWSEHTEFPYRCHGVILARRAEGLGL